MTDTQPAKEHHVTRTEELVNQIESFFSSGMTDMEGLKVIEMMRDYGKKATIQAAKRYDHDSRKKLDKMRKMLTSLRDQYYQQELANKKVSKKKAGAATVKGDVYLRLKGDDADLKRFFGDHVSGDAVKVDLGLLKRLESALSYELTELQPNRRSEIDVLSNLARKARRGDNNPSLLNESALSFFAEAELGLTLDGKKLSEVIKPIFKDKDSDTYGVISNNTLTRLMSIYNRHHKLGVAEEGYGSIFTPDTLMKKHFKSQLEKIQKKADASMKKDGYDKKIKAVGLDYSKIDTVKKLIDLTDKLLNADANITKSQAKLISFGAAVVSGLGIRFSDLRILISEIILPLRDLEPKDKETTENKEIRETVVSISAEVDKFFDHLSAQAKH